MEAISKPRFVVDESGNRTGVILDLSDYESLLKAWEEVSDCEDFDYARKSSEEFIPVQELRNRLAKQS